MHVPCLLNFLLITQFFFCISQGASLFKFVLFPTFWGTLNCNFQEPASTMGCCCSVAKVVSDSLDCSMPGFPVLHYLPELAQIHVHWFGDGIQPSYSLSPLSPPALNLFQHQVLFQWVGSLHQVPEYWSFSFNISPFSEYSGLISFRIDWFDLLAVQELSRVFSFSALFTVQLSHPYSTMDG